MAVDEYAPWYGGISSNVSIMVIKTEFLCLICIQRRPDYDLGDEGSSDWVDCATILDSQHGDGEPTMAIYREETTQLGELTYITVGKYRATVISTIVLDNQPERRAFFLIIESYRQDSNEDGRQGLAILTQ